MSGRNSTVSLTLQIRGQQAGQEIKRITDQQITATKQINQQWVQISSAQAKFATTAKAGTQATVQTARASDGLLRTNRMMEGVLRQQSIQTKIQSQQYKTQQTAVQRLTGLININRSSKHMHATNPVSRNFRIHSIAVIRIFHYCQLISIVTHVLQNFSII